MEGVHFARYFSKALFEPHQRRAIYKNVFSCKGQDKIKFKDIIVEPNLTQTIVTYPEKVNIYLNLS